MASTIAATVRRAAASPWAVPKVSSRQGQIIQQRVCSAHSAGIR
jgi:hypothetical protein